MSCNNLASLLVACVVFACVSSVQVDVGKRLVPLGALTPDLLGEGSLLDDTAMKSLFKSIAVLVKNLRKTLEGLHICPKGEYPEGEHGHHEHGNEDLGDHEHEYNHLEYIEYKRETEDSKLDMACQILKPIFEAVIKLMKQLEKTLGCMSAKPDSYKGDYNECQG